MSDTQQNTQRTLGNVLGLKGKSKPMPMPGVMTEAELHDESIVYALAGTRQLRDKVAETTAELSRISQEYATFKSDAAAELITQKQEYEAKLANLRADNAARVRQIEELGAKLEHFQRWCFQLETKCEDFVKFFKNVVATIHDTCQHSAVSMMANVNNTTAALQDAAKHINETMTKQIKTSAEDMYSFLDDIERKRDHAEYRPKEDRKAAPPQPSPPVMDEEALQKLAKRFAPLPLDQQEQSDG
jgi:chromosome segregation ATPase